ncbi:hypothetical protein AX15_004397 [Amanita polypyramis BW_CC]|nr:hypothetical protein AX15_004397 [Amanita polypyramis BW_CC]
MASDDDGDIPGLGMLQKQNPNGGHASSGHNSHDVALPPAPGISNNHANNAYTCIPAHEYAVRTHPPTTAATPARTHTHTRTQGPTSSTTSDTSTYDVITSSPTKVQEGTTQSQSSVKDKSVRTPGSLPHAANGPSVSTYPSLGPSRSGYGSGPIFTNRPGIPIPIPVAGSTCSYDTGHRRGPWSDAVRRPYADFKPNYGTKASVPVPAPAPSSAVSSSQGKAKKKRDRAREDNGIAQSQNLMKDKPQPKEEASMVKMDPMKRRIPKKKVANVPGPGSSSTNSMAISNPIPIPITGSASASAPTAGRRHGPGTSFGLSTGSKPNPGRNERTHMPTPSSVPPPQIKTKTNTKRKRNEAEQDNGSRGLIKDIAGRSMTPTSTSSYSVAQTEARALKAMKARTKKNKKRTGLKPEPGTDTPAPTHTPIPPLPQTKTDAKHTREEVEQDGETAQCQDLIKEGSNPTPTAQPLVADGLISASIDSASRPEVDPPKVKKDPMKVRIPKIKRPVGDVSGTGSATGSGSAPANTLAPSSILPAVQTEIDTGKKGESKYAQSIDSEYTCSPPFVDITSVSSISSRARGASVDVVSTSFRDAGAGSPSTLRTESVQMQGEEKQIRKKKNVHGEMAVNKPKKRKSEGVVDEKEAKAVRAGGEEARVEKPPRKRKKVDNVRDSAKNPKDVTTSGGQNEGTGTAAEGKNEGDGKEKAKSGSGEGEEGVKPKRGRKRKSTVGDGEAESGPTSGPSRKGKKVRLDGDEDGAGDDEYGNENSHGLGEGAKMRGKESSAIKWMVTPKLSQISGIIKSRKARASKAGSKTKPTSSITHNRTAGDSESGYDTPGRFLRPTIWAASKSELLLVLPELTSAKSCNGITEGSSNFPMVLLDDTTAESIAVKVIHSTGGSRYGTVMLTITRDFVCPVGEFLGAGNGSREAAPAVPESGSSGHVACEPQAPVSALTGLDEPREAEDDDDTGLEYIDEVPPCLPAQLQQREEEHQPGGVLTNKTALPDTLPQADSRGSTETVHQSLESSQITEPTTPPSFHATPAHSVPATHQNPVPDRIHTRTQSPNLDPPPSTPLPPPPQISSLRIDKDDIQIPPVLPPEIDILTASWNLSLPIILISSKEVFNKIFNNSSSSSTSTSTSTSTVGLSDEHAYVFLGFFKFRGESAECSAGRIVDVKVNEKEVGKVWGRVEWAFEIEWVPRWDGKLGGGEGIGRDTPWWTDVLGRTSGTESGGGASVSEGYRAQVQPQHWLNLVPIQLVDGQEEGSADEAMPRGWLCKKCGRLNQKVMMRHRWCGGLSCRDDPVSGGYAVELGDARDPNQTPLALPINVCDEFRVDVRVADWDDGMRTLKYKPMVCSSTPVEFMAMAPNEGLQHVFTCNSEDLQREATPLFARIQRDVCLSKNIGDLGAHFKCNISDTYTGKMNKYAFSCMSWSEAPQVVRDAQDLMLFMGRNYGENEGLVIDRMTIVGWVSSGTRKTNEKLAAKDRTIAMMCLGNDVILTVTPKWEISANDVDAQERAQAQVLAQSTSMGMEAPTMTVEGGALSEGMMRAGWGVMPAPDVLLGVNTGMDGVDGVNVGVEAVAVAAEAITGRVGQPGRSETPTGVGSGRVDAVPTPMMAADSMDAAYGQHSLGVAGDRGQLGHERLISAQASAAGAGVPAGKKTRVQSDDDPEWSSRVGISAGRFKLVSKHPMLDTISVTLVHGDMLLFSGCDFEVSREFKFLLYRY